MGKVIKFGASWCGPCRAYKPTFEKVSKMDEFGDVDFQELDVDTYEDEAMKYGIRGVPSTVFINNKGEVVDKLTGLQTEDALVKKIREAFGKA
jgi:thioredoxin 1